MFKMQKITIISEKNVATDKKYILRRMGLEFQNPKFQLSCKIALHTIFGIKCEPFGVKRSMRPFWNKQN